MSTKARAVRAWSVGLAATLLLSASPIALHAETSNAELAKEIAELKAQIHAMRGAIAENRVETRKTTAKVRAVADRGPSVPAPAASALPDGAVPVFVTANKQMQFGALTITPGGFIDMYGIGRTRSTQSDTQTPAGIPTLNSNAAHVGEARLSARNTRVALLVESAISSNMLVAGYGELDFRNAGTNSSPGQVNNFAPRVRHLYATLDNNELGVHVLAGQNWSLVTANSKGITPRNEAIPPTLDNITMVGFDYSRTPQIRLVKDFNKKLWLGLSVENPQTGGIAGNGSCPQDVSNTGAAVSGNITPNAVTGVAGGTCVVAAAGSTDFGGTGTAQNVTLNKIPNVVGKVAYEARIGDRDVHLEALGMFKVATNYVNYGNAVANAGFGGGYSSNSEQNIKEGGVGGNIVFAVLPTKLDFQAGGEYGTGFGYYMSSGLADVTTGLDGKPRALKGESAYAGLVAHVTPAIDVYAYAGIDQLDRNFSQYGNVQTGYGAINGTNNSGCYIVGGTCAGQTHRVYELTMGFSDKLYKGSFGEVRVSAQYEFLHRDLFSGTASATGPTAAQPILGASTVDHIVMTSLRALPKSC